MEPFGTAAGQITSPEEIQELAMAFQRSRVLLTAYELGIFSLLGAEGRSSPEVAAAVEADPRGVDRLLNACCAVGLLRKKEGRFFNTEAAARFLVEGEAGYMAGLGHVVNLWQTWSTLTAAVRKGGRAWGGDSPERGEEWTKNFIAAMHQRATQTAPQIVARLDLTGVKRVLDVGGGSGAYAAAFVRAGQGITATVFDLPGVIPLTKRYVAQVGLSKQIDFVPGDYETDELGRGFDLVFLSAIIHSNSPAQNQELIRKAARALNPGGQVVIQDFIVNEDRTAPAFGALFALNMLVGTEAGDTYTAAEVEEWLSHAGLSDLERRAGLGPTSLIIGRQPKA